MGADVTIPPATAADEAAITDLHARCIGDAFAGRYVPPAEERAERQSGWAGLIGAPHPRRALLVAEHAARLVGFVAVGPARDPDRDSATSAELRVILGDARARRLGVGSALIASRERAMQQSGISDATLWVLPDNAQVQNIFAKLGVSSRPAAGAFAFEHHIV